MRWYLWSVVAVYVIIRILRLLSVLLVWHFGEFVFLDSIQDVSGGSLRGLPARFLFYLQRLLGASLTGSYDPEYKCAILISPLTFQCGYVKAPVVAG